MHVLWQRLRGEIYGAAVRSQMYELDALDDYFPSSGLYEIVWILGLFGLEDSRKIWRRVCLELVAPARLRISMFSLLRRKQDLRRFGISPPSRKYSILFLFLSQWLPGNSLIPRPSWFLALHEEIWNNSLSIFLLQCIREKAFRFWRERTSPPQGTLTIVDRVTMRTRKRSSTAKDPMKDLFYWPRRNTKKEKNTRVQAAGLNLSDRRIGFAVVTTPPQS